jgi:vacuolar-type H+-ATPase subunit H
VTPDRPGRRRDIEDSTAARLAEIVAAAEQAARQVIDEAEEEARNRLSDAHEEADRIVAERLAGLAGLTAEMAAQAEALRRQAEALQRAVADATAELGGAESLGGSVPTGPGIPDPEPKAESGARKPFGPSLSIVGAPEEAERPERPAGTVEGDRRDAPAAAIGFEDSAAGVPTAASTPAGARLLATQMAVSGSSRDEIEARLRNGFAISDTRSILDAILGPEK